MTEVELAGERTTVPVSSQCPGKCSMDWRERTTVMMALLWKEICNACLSSGYRSVDRVNAEGTKIVLIFHSTSYLTPMHNKIMKN